MSIIQESSQDGWQLKRSAVREGALRARSACEEGCEGGEEGEHHFGGKVGAWSHAVVVAQVLPVFVGGELGVGEGGAEGGEGAGYLGLKAAEVGEDGDVRGGEV